MGDLFLQKKKWTSAGYEQEAEEQQCHQGEKCGGSEHPGEP